MLSVPISMAPAASSRPSRRDSPAPQAGGALRDPRLERREVRKNMSLCASGTPCSGPSGRPSATAASARSAAASAESARTAANALIRGCHSPMRVRHVSTTSRLVTRPARIASATSTSVQLAGLNARQEARRVLDEQSGLALPQARLDCCDRSRSPGGNPLRRSLVHPGVSLRTCERKYGIRVDSVHAAASISRRPGPRPAAFC